MRLQKPVFTALLIFLVLSESACPKKEQMIDSQPEIQKSSPNDVNNKEVTVKMIHHFTLSEGWVPSNKTTLQKTIKDLLEKAEIKDKADFKQEKARGLIAPHAGYRYSAQCAAHAYKILEGHSYKRVFVLGPNHHVRGLKGVSVSKATHYETPLGEVPVDIKICKELLQNKYFSNVPETEEGEHSVEIQIPFLQTVLDDFKLIPIVVGDLSPKETQQVAETIQAYIDDETLVVASSDFMHYGEGFGYTPFADNIRENIYKTDSEAIQNIIKLDRPAFQKHLDKTENTICGRNPIGLLMAILPDTTGTLLNYYTSGDLTKDFQTSVSYAAIAFTDYKLNDDEQKTLLQLARKSLQTYLKSGGKTEISPEKLTPSLQRLKGVFVTLKKKGQLRGCIGCIPPTNPLYQVVINYAVNSAVNDPRFSPMTMAEEPLVDIEISVLSSLKRVKGPEDIVVGKHGAYMVKGRSAAIFLPQVAPEQGWDRNTMLSELSLKAGMNEDAWREKDALFYVFTAQVFGEKE
jgi:AmmeMemoRadiSam system protein B/AmmeMemoRadiSam system protein A